MLSPNDLELLKTRGTDSTAIEQQIENFRQGFPFVKLVAPATIGHGVKGFDEKLINELATFYEQAGPDYHVVKFVPASGAASRMFKHLFEFMQSYKGTDDDIEALEKDKGFNSVFYFLQNLRKFAFIDDLEQALANDGYSLRRLLELQEYNIIISFLLTSKGLDYGNLPKGLLQFHVYDGTTRKPVEEHLVEGAHYARGREDDVFIHLTVSPEHLDKFLDVIEEVQHSYEKMFGVKYHVSFSIQKPSTDTIAVDMDNEPVREDGNLVFRPGGHGALIENLNDIAGDIIFIKNIDNIVPDRLKEPTYLYKKVIGGLLIRLKEKTDGYLQQLESKLTDNKLLSEIATFAEKELLIDLGDGFKTMPVEKRVNFLFNRLVRPIRICGMVKNEGEPGGGPFWLENAKGEVSLQIVESSQIDMKDPTQKQIFDGATHFNPVDLVCSMKDYKGNRFDLRQFIDPSTGFISVKSKDGKSLKAQELPGLWNGAMAGWITIFVETPIITFNPVKTINDLLREQHLPG